MAKLEDQTTPLEFLNLVRSGAMKSELAKKYRTTDQDMAIMLLPLYRSGQMTKEEFNDFFNEVPLRIKNQVVQTKTEDESPSEILASLSKFFGKKPKAQDAFSSPTEISHEITKEAELKSSEDDEVAAQSITSHSETKKAENKEVSNEEPPEFSIEDCLQLILKKLSHIEKRIYKIEKKL